MADDLLEEADRLIRALTTHPDPAVREQVTTLLQAIDAVHRTGLHHLVGAIQAMAGESFLNRLVADPAVRVLFMSYEILPLDRRLQAEEAIDAARGPLHDRGVDVELREVEGGLVAVRLHGLERAGLAEEDVRRAVEGALREHLVGFHELVIADERRGGAAALIPVDALRGARRPVFQEAGRLEALADGALRPVEVAGRPVLLARRGDEVFAVANRCGDTPLPLEFGRLEGDHLVCSWHGCRYDLRTGVPERGAERLAVFPVRVQDGLVQVAVSTAPAKGDPAARIAPARP